MQILLVNTNAAVGKIFSIAAQRAAIHLDNVSAISQISLQKNYSCVFIDDGVLDSGNFIGSKNRMTATRFYIVLSKDAPIVDGFDGYIRKPFLPTDIYEVLKKGKSDEVDSMTYELKTESEPQSTNDFNHSIHDDNGIDLSEFSDSEDEFLSGIKDSSPIPMVDRNPELQDLENNAANFEDADTFKTEVDDNMDIAFTYDSSNAKDDVLEVMPSDAESTSYMKDKVDSAQCVSEESLETQEYMPFESSSETSYQSETQNQSTNGESDIDFSSIFAMQDEFLESQQKKHSKFAIGGDIYKKKETSSQPSKPPPQHSEFAHQEPAQQIQPQSEQQMPHARDIAPNARKSAHSPRECAQPLHAHAQPHAHTMQADQQVVSAQQNTPAQPTHAQESLHTQEPHHSHVQDPFDIDFSSMPLDDVEQESLLSAKDELEGFDGNDFSFNDAEWNDDVAGISENDFSSYDFDTDMLSGEELESLDDEALLKLQEDSLGTLDDMFSKGITQNAYNSGSPKQILSEDEINELTNILESNDLTHSSAQDEEQDMNAHDDFGYVAQEVLSEALNESNSNKMGADSRFESRQINENHINTQPAHVQPQDTTAAQPNTHINVGEMQSNVNIDLSEIIKSYPVDKLRELLSGAQITISITFPTTKK